MENSEASAAGQKWMVFRVAEAPYALPAANVTGAVSVAAAEISPMPLGQTNNIMGMLSHRGDAVAIAQIEGLFLPQYRFARELTLLLARSEGRPFALPVDQVLGLMDDGETGNAARLSADALYRGRLG